MREAIWKRNRKGSTTADGVGFGRMQAEKRKMIGKLLLI